MQCQLPAFHDNVYMFQENETPYLVPTREEEQLEHVKDRVNIFSIPIQMVLSLTLGNV